MICICDIYFMINTETNKAMTTTYKNIKINYGKGSACIMFPKFKGFASDETKDGLSGLEKAKRYIDSL